MAYSTMHQPNKRFGIVSYAKYREIHATLQELAENNNYTVIQHNGQRIFCPLSSANIPEPPRGCEIFIGNLPSNFYEDEIIPIFSRIGPIYNIRLMMDFSGRSRGYAFISYFCEEDAYSAVRELDGFRVRGKVVISVNLSVDNRRLFVGHLRPNVTAKMLHDILSEFVEGIKHVIMYPSPKNPLHNRGFAFVEFVSHRMAAIARKQLNPASLTVAGQEAYIDWAEPLPIVDPKLFQQVTVLYLSNLPSDIPTRYFVNIVLNIIQMGTDIVKIYKGANYAFLNFRDRPTAEVAMARLQGVLICGFQVGVEWARPAEYNKVNRCNYFASTFCRSVPPMLRKQVLIRRQIAMREKATKYNNSRVYDDNNNPQSGSGSSATSYSE